MKRLTPFRLPQASWHRGSGYSGSERVDVAVSTERSAVGAVPFVWCHGFAPFDTNPARYAVESPYKERLSAVAAFGHPVLSADLGGGSTWANDTALARIESLLAWANTNYGARTDKVAMAGESMGSLLAFNWAWRYPHRLAALWVRAPITAMDALHDRDAALGTAMEGAYGGLSAYNAALPTRDPVQNRAVLTSVADRTRIEFTHDDEIVVAAEVLDHIDGTGVTEWHAWPGDHADNRWTDTWAVAKWVHDTVRGITG